jgi:hypothetical protein
MASRSRLPIFAMALALSVWVACAGDRSAPLSQDEQALKTAGIPLDDAGLLQFFRQASPSEEQKALLKQRAAQLGSSVYAVRMRATDELIHAGRASLPYLREIANTGDAETVHRARYCLQVIERNKRLGLAATVSRVLADRKVSGTAEALLGYLPFIDEVWVEEEVRQNLKRIAYANGKATAPLEQALASPETKRRALAAWIVGGSSDAGQRRQVIALLADAAPEVRLFAADALLVAHEREAVPTLIALLSADSHDLAFRAEDLLTHLAGATGPTVWLDSTRDDNGGKVRAAWETWWKANADTIVWPSLNLGEQSLGLTLVIENQRPDGAGRIYETNRAGLIRWQVAAQNPIDAQWLTGGRLLVCDSRSSQIYEMDTRGVVGWKHTNLSATSCQRLPNGNTVVSTYSNILEITREGKTVFSHQTQGHTFHARKLPDGHYVWIDACGEIGEIDGAGKPIAAAKVAAPLELAWGSIERLRNGHFLVALGGVGKVQEVDMAGKVYWSKAVKNPNRAVRLDNGHTLVASHGDQCIYEFDAAGERRWKHECAGRPFAVARR